jgi:DHA1 family tetracycline resistance protein-like MFS transporter
MTGYGLATHGWMVYLIMLVGAWGGLALPSAQALITKHVPPDEQGALQGSLSGLTSLAYVFGPFFAAWSFGKGIAHPDGLYVPGIAFFEAATLMVIAMALALRSFKLDDRIGAKA